MWPIVTDRVEWLVDLSVCHIVSPAKTAEPIELPFGLWTWFGRKNHVLDFRPDPLWEGALLRRRRGGPL